VDALKGTTFSEVERGIQGFVKQLGPVLPTFHEQALFLADLLQVRTCAAGFLLQRAYNTFVVCRYCVLSIHLTLYLIISYDVVCEQGMLRCERIEFPSFCFWVK
jgi:hypothetical protein